MSASDEQAFQFFIDDLQTGKLSYADATRRYQELGDAIRRRYERTVSALSADIVHSREMKASGSPLDAQLTFDAYHLWVEEQLQKHGCTSFTWAGDGLLAVFQRPDAAVEVGQRLVDGIRAFNARFNRLPRPLELRVGVHSGPILAEDAAGLGKVASRTFDLAGHLQKAAASNQLLVSDETYPFLRDPGGHFVLLLREVPGMGSCYAYPPESAQPGLGLDVDPHADGTRTRYIDHRTVPPSVPLVEARPGAAAAHERSALPWILAAAGAAGCIAVLVTVALLGPNRGTGPGASADGIHWRQEPESATPGVTDQGTDAGNMPPANVPPANSPAGNSPAAPGNAPAPAPAGAAPLGGPSRAVWTSPEEHSGLPARFVASAPEQKWLLAIGADAAGTDADLAARVLQASAGVLPDHVRRLTGTEATLDGIRMAFEWLQQGAGSGKDTVFVYLAGDAQSVGGYVFLPHGSDPKNAAETGVSGADLAAWLGATHAQSIVLFADTPVSAGMDIPSSADSGRQFGLIAAASGGVRVPGSFAQALADGLRGQADRDNDRRVSLAELSQYLTGEVPRRSSGAQTPQARPGFGGYMPDLYFAPAP